MRKGNAISIQKFQSERESTHNTLLFLRRMHRYRIMNRDFSLQFNRNCVALQQTMQHVKLLHNFLPNIRAIYLVNDWYYHFTSIFLLVSLNLNSIKLKTSTSKFFQILTRYRAISIFQERGKEGVEKKKQTTTLV